MPNQEPHDKPRGARWIFVATPVELAKTRNETRERSVPEGVIDSMHTSLSKDPPSVVEGGENVSTLNKHHDLLQTERMRGGRRAYAQALAPKLP